jgi:hypothetical protein
MPSNPEKKPKPLALGDPLLAPRLMLPGVTRYVRMRMFKWLSLSLTFAFLGGLTIGWGFDNPTVGLLCGLPLLVTVPAAAVFFLIVSATEPRKTLPGPRAVNPK